MIYKEYNVSQSAGVILGSSLSLGEKFYPKGHEITAEDVLIFKMFGLHFIYGAEYQDGDIEYKTAYTQIASHICGNGLGYIIKGEDCLITALDDGIFAIDKHRIDKFNGFNPNVVVNTIAPFSAVKKGNIVARLDVLPPLLSEKELEDILFRLSGNSALLTLAENKKHRAVFIYSHLENDAKERAHYTDITMHLLGDLAEY